MHPHRAPISKWRFFALYWAVQAPLVLVGWGLLAGAPGPWAILEVWHDDPAFTAWCGGVLASIAALQGAFLLGVRAPAIGPGGRWSRAARCALAAVAMGLMSAVAAAAVVMVIDGLGLAGAGAPLLKRGGPLLFWVFYGIAALLSWLWLLRASHSGASVRLSVAIAALGAAALSVGIPWVSYSVLATLLKEEVSASRFVVATCAALLLNWAVAAPLLGAYVRRRGAENAFGRIAAWLFTGTLVEAAAVIPIDVMVRRRSNCYCGEGTLWTLTICWGVGFFALGPAIWLIPLAKRRKRWYGGHCPVCDYDMCACMSAERCPECGAGWKAPPPGA
jgi:hypothetical protein